MLLKSGSGLWSVFQFIFTSAWLHHWLVEWWADLMFACLFWWLLFYITLFSAVEQTHCTSVACDSMWATVAFYEMFWISTKVECIQYFWLLHLVPHETAAISAPVYAIQPCAMSHHFMQSHICRVQVHLAVNLPPALLAERWGSFACYCDNTGVEQIPK